MAREPSSSAPSTATHKTNPAVELPEANTPYHRFFGPSQPPVMVEFAAKSDTGKVRKKNEDHFLVERQRRSLDLLLHNLPPTAPHARHDEDAYVMAVADGMGGAAFGELASALALRAGLDLVLSAVKWSVKFTPGELAELEDKIDAYFNLIDKSLIDQGWTEPRLNGMGTTLTIVYTVGLEAFIGHAGDSRAYRSRSGGLQRLTHDHTVAQDLADRGAISQQDVSTHRLRHTLTNYLGGAREGVNPDFIHLRLEHNDILLLCSDGLTDMVDDEAISTTLARAVGLDAAADSLVTQALDAGGKDNITVILGRYRFPEPPETDDFPAIPSPTGLPPDSPR